jgi:hypothetical protein
LVVKWGEDDNPSRVRVVQGELWLENVHDVVPDVIAKLAGEAEKRRRCAIALGPDAASVTALKDTLGV